MGNRACSCTVGIVGGSRHPLPGIRDGQCSLGVAEPWSNRSSFPRRRTRWCTGWSAGCRRTVDDGCLGGGVDIDRSDCSSRVASRHSRNGPACRRCAGRDRTNRWKSCQACRARDNRAPAGVEPCSTGTSVDGSAAPCIVEQFNLEPASSAASGASGGSESDKPARSAELRRSAAKFDRCARRPDSA
jgi:hypothetical protein